MKRHQMCSVVRMKRLLSDRLFLFSTFVMCFFSIAKYGFEVSRGFSPKKPANVQRASKAQWKDLQLFVPTFPGKGFEEIQTTLIRSLQFFWPLEHLNILVVLDENVVQGDTERKSMTANVKSFFREGVQSVSVAYNPRWNQSIYGQGWCIQQLIMFWADNFTDAEYIGFLDDDSLFSMAVTPADLFDSQGRPRVFSRYYTGSKDIDWVRIDLRQSHFAYGWPAYVFTMAYFPVIIRRDHLSLIRSEILRRHKEYSYFDEFFLALRKRDGRFCQFCIMFEYLWRYQREDYSWHFEADHVKGPFYPDGFPNNSDIAKAYPYISAGTPETNGVTSDMLRPFPRVCVHASYIKGGEANDATQRRALVSDIMRRGYCFSQPKSHWSKPEFLKRCQSLNVTAGDINVRNQWDFESFAKPWPWPDSKPQLQQAHEERTLRNPDHLWDMHEVRAIFGSQ